MFTEGRKYLITTDNWFIAPDGRDYRSVWGTVEVLPDSDLGVKTNRNSSNWFIRVGSGNNSVVIAGCQIHYAVDTETKPNTEPTPCQTYGSGELNEFIRHSAIWITE